MIKKTIVCKRCKEETPKRCKGRQFYCVRCAKIIDTEIKRKSDEKRRNSKHRKEWREKYKKTYRKRKREYDKKYYQEHREHYLGYSKKYREEHKEEIIMRTYAFRFMKKRLLKKANNKCENCGSTENLQLHHKEYTQRNKKEFREEDMKKIMVLCAICHKNIHLKREPTHKEHIGIRK